MMKEEHTAGPMYAYFLPTGCDIDDLGVQEAMLWKQPGVALFLDLGNGDVIELALPRDQELYENMKREIFAYAEIPRLEIPVGASKKKLLHEAFAGFIESLPVTVELDEAVYDDEFSDEDCDCPNCTADGE